MLLLIGVSLSTNLVAEAWCVSVVNPVRITGFAQGELAQQRNRADAILLAKKVCGL
ncbi:hypothetical protein [Nitrosomonas communis]|uniref:hypothetical protein n=1 Tax=Nitrosomonas communis TaxID=44574 RepID=UPI0015A6CFBF|nr:hypothetical protein [Nitrosomonas communis]